MEEKSYFFALFGALIQTFLHFLLGIVEKHAKKKLFNHGFKKMKSQASEMCGFEHSLKCSISTKSANLQGR